MESEGGYEAVATGLETLQGSCWVPCRERGEEKTERCGVGTRKYNRRLMRRKKRRNSGMGQKKERYKKAKKKVKRTVAKVRTKRFRTYTSI